MDPKKILLVDDDRDLVSVLKFRLEQKGYAVQCAYKGTEVFVCLDQQRPDLIILDVMMPEMDGFEALKRLRGNGETSSIPVILLTAKTQYKDVAHGYALGADYYMTKPFTSTQLLLAVSALITGRKPEGPQTKPITCA